MQPRIIDEIPVNLEPSDLIEQVSTTAREEGSRAEQIKDLVNQAQQIATPKTIFREAHVSGKKEQSVIIEGVEFTSRVLRVNLEDAYRVFPFLVTCGTELKNWAETVVQSPLEKYWAEEIMEQALRAGEQWLLSRIKSEFNLGKFSRMTPGSLEDWPLESQRQLFQLLDANPKSIGVRLTDDYLMVPAKSTSGICFPLEFDFSSCQLCSRDDCPERKAPYDPELYEERYSYEL